MRYSNYHPAQKLQFKRPKRGQEVANIHDRRVIYHFYCPNFHQFLIPDLNYVECNQAKQLPTKNYLLWPFTTYPVVTQWGNCSQWGVWTRQPVLFHKGSASSPDKNVYKLRPDHKEKVRKIIWNRWDAETHIYWITIYCLTDLRSSGQVVKGSSETISGNWKKPVGHKKRKICCS